MLKKFDHIDDIKNQKLQKLCTQLEDFYNPSKIRQEIQDIIDGKGDNGYALRNSFSDTEPAYLEIFPNFMAHLTQFEQSIRPTTFIYVTEKDTFSSYTLGNDANYCQLDYENDA